MRARRPMKGLRIAGLIVAVALSRRTAAAQRVDPQTRDSIYSVITKGLLGTPVFPLHMQTVPLDLGVRNFVMGPGEAQGVPVPFRMIMELRGGMLTTTINGARVDRRTGDFWVVESGSSLSLVNRGDVAVIRVVQLQERH